jgi:hypothetical protein
LGKEKKSKCGGEEKNGKNRWEKALVNWVPGRGGARDEL